MEELLSNTEKNNEIKTDIENMRATNSTTLQSVITDIRELEEILKNYTDNQKQYKKSSEEYLDYQNDIRRVYKLIKILNEYKELYKKDNEELLKISRLFMNNSKERNSESKETLSKY